MPQTQVAAGVDRMALSDLSTRSAYPRISKSHLRRTEVGTQLLHRDHQPVDRKADRCDYVSGARSIGTAIDLRPDTSSWSLTGMPSFRTTSRSSRRAERVVIVFGATLAKSIWERSCFRSASGRNAFKLLVGEAHHRAGYSTVSVYAENLATLCRS